MCSLLVLIEVHEDLLQAQQLFLQMVSAHMSTLEPGPAVFS